MTHLFPTSLLCSWVSFLTTLSMGLENMAEAEQASRKRVGTGDVAAVSLSVLGLSLSLLLPQRCAMLGAVSRPFSVKHALNCSNTFAKVASFPLRSITKYFNVLGEHLQLPLC